MEIRPLILYIQKQFTLGILLGTIIPLSLYKFIVVLAPKPDIENSQEFKDIQNLKQKIKDIKNILKKEQKNYLEIKYSEKNLDEKSIKHNQDIEDLKKQKESIKKVLKEKENIIQEKIRPAMLWHETTLFYAALLAGTTSFLFGTAIKIIPIATGLILGSLYCLFMAHYTFLGKLSGAINLFYVLLILIGTLILALFFIRKKEYEN